MALGELHGRNLASALVRSRVHNRTRDRGGKPIWLACAVGTAPGPSGRTPPMPTPSHQRSRKRMPNPDRRRALELLASSPDGCTEGLMVANGFTVELLLELVRTGLASAHAERRIVDGKMTEVARVGITHTGRALVRSDA